MNDKLLVIELEEETSIPRVIYKGEEITRRIKVSFAWETRTDEYGGMKYHLEFADKSVEDPNVKTIEHKTGKFTL